MFLKLKRKFFTSIFLSSLIFILLVSAVSFCIITQDIYKMQKDKAQIEIESGIDGYLSYFDTVMGFVENLSNNDKILNVVTGGENSDIQSLLDGLCNYSFKIDGTILYGVTGYIACSSGVGSIPPLHLVLTDTTLIDFWASKDKSIIIARTENIPSVYHHNFYNQSSGVISCVSKVYDSNGFIMGLLVADIFPQTLTQLSMGFDCFKAVGIVNILKDGVLLTETKFLDEIYNQGNKIFNNCYIARQKFLNSCELVVVFPMSTFNEQILFMFMMFLGVDILLSLLSFVFAKIVSSNVVFPLNLLLKKMQNQTMYQ